MHAYPQQKEHLRPHKSENRTRSTSRAPTKLYNADAPRRYAPNESRPRKPPHSPTVEDVGIEFDEVQMRGKLDQTPMLITVGDESSSSDSGASLTPESSTSDEQRERVDRRDTRARGRNGPSAKAAGAKSQPPFQPLDSQEPSRGRRQGLTVDTDSARSVSAGGEPPANYERARSPYSYRPPQNTQEETHKARPVPASRAPPAPRGTHATAGTGEYFLSPEILSPSVHTSRNGSASGSGSSGSYFQPQTASAHPHDSRPSYSRKRSEVTQETPQRPTRPPIERRVSALPQLGSNPKSAQTASAARSRYVESSSDEDRKYAKIRSQSGQLSSEALPTKSSYFDTPLRPERQYNSSLHNSPPRSPLSPEHTRGTFLNRDALLTGSGLQHLSSQLEGLHSDSRRASPRASPLPSPRASPTHSPFASPPRTPPEPPRHHKRSTTVESLKKDSPTSRPSSPLSSRPSSPNPAAQKFSVRSMENEVPPSPGLSKDRRTSTWDSATGSARDPYSRPLADARAPPAAVPNHDRVASYEKTDSQYRRDRHPSYNPTGGLGVSVEPAHGGSRQRSSSNASARGPPVLHQTTSDPSRASDARPPSGPYVPAAAGAMLGAGLADSGSSHRSRSTAPGSSHRHRSRSRTAPDVRTVPRSRSSAPVAVIAASDAPTQPAFLPPCPRTEPVAGYDDWYELAINRSESNMDICPDCRTNIFGSGYERDFRRRDLPERGEKLMCGISDPWVRLACLEQFKKRKHDTTLLKYLAEVSKDYSACPQGHLVEDRKWYHLRDNETDKDYDEFQICSHCLMSLEVLYPKMADMFHRSKDIERKKDPRVCDLRSDVVRFGQYLDHLGSMDRQLKETGRDPNTSDFIWQVKLMTVITPCRGDAIHYGQDMHLHPDIPELTICEECYYKDVRPIVKKFSRADPRHFALKISPDAKEKVGGTSCMLYSARMKQIFESACLDRDFEALDKAVKKRNGLLKDLEEAKMLYHKTPTDPALKEDVEYLTDKWKKLARKHDRN